MSELRNIIDQRVAVPAVRAGAAFRSVGRVSVSDEINNVCTLEYVDSSGVFRNKTNVPVQIHSYGLVDWFPMVGENVDVEEIGANVSIVGKHFEDYNTGLRPQRATKNDILPDDFSNTCGGSVF